MDFNAIAIGAANQKVSVAQALATGVKDLKTGATGETSENKSTSIFESAASALGNLGKMPTNKTVMINGKVHQVVKVPNNNLILKSFAQMYKEVVIIDGKQYDVETVKDWVACDKTKQVVYVDGKRYDVKTNGLNLDGLRFPKLRPYDV